AEQDRAVMRIVSTSDRPALERVLPRSRPTDRAFERRVRAMVERVRAEAARVSPEVHRALRQAARNIARVARRQIPKGWRLKVAAGVSIEQRVEPLAR